MSSFDTTPSCELYILRSGDDILAILEKEKAEILFKHFDIGRYITIEETSPLDGLNYLFFYRGVKIEITYDPQNHELIANMEDNDNYTPKEYKGSGFGAEDWEFFITEIKKDIDAYLLRNEEKELQERLDAVRKQLQAHAT